MAPAVGARTWPPVWPPSRLQSLREADVCRDDDGDDADGVLDELLEAHARLRDDVARYGHARCTHAMHACLRRAADSKTNASNRGAHTTAPPVGAASR